MAASTQLLTIGETAKRAGVTVSTLRFYEARGLISSIRTTGNQRRFARSMLRRISVVRVAQTIGLTLEEISNALESLPEGKAPTQKDWEKLSTTWRGHLDDRINQLQLVREKLTGCIGCGCLSLQNCALYNPGDRAHKQGAGPRYLLGDLPEN